MNKQLVHACRAYEVDLLRPWFRPGMKVLELGGGDGFQAQRMASWRTEIDSIDVAPAACAYFPVRTYGGREIPFPENQFDAVFSSNTLEHIRDIRYTLGETRRVLKPRGLALHTVPTSSWRFWTSLAHYPNLLKLLITRGRQAGAGAPGHPDSGPEEEMDKTHFRKPSYFRRRLRMLASAAHGEYPCAASELFYFSRYRWTALFQQAGFSIVHWRPSGLFYTGYMVLGSRVSMTVRQRMANVLGSACHVFVLQAEK